MTATITEPGVYDLDDPTYHGDPVPGGSLSSSGARSLLATCPAKFHHEQTAGRSPKAAFDFGHAAHQMVLGTGPEIVVVDADNWRTKAAQKQQADAYEAGKVPLLLKDAEVVAEMAEALRKHPFAPKLLRPGRGRPERSLFWRDRRTGIMRRAKLDWLPDKPAKGRLLVTDYKTTLSAEPAAIAKSVHNYGYHQQAPWYLDGIEELDLAGPDGSAFVFIFQEKTAPYLVTVAELDAESLAWGELLNAKAIDVYRRCVETETWPGYAEDVVTTSLPRYAVTTYEAALARGDLKILEKTR